jgi:putative two-component system hydrogenase maturation factor HypX/HoxX
MSCVERTSLLSIETPMRILLLCSTFNSLSQRLFVDLREAGHTVAVEIDAHERLLNDAVTRLKPDILIAPYLRRAIPASVLARLPCLVVHPGPVGDGGPNALDHAILDGAGDWGVTVLRATPELDAGPVLASRKVKLRAAPKSDLYRTEITQAAVAAVFEAMARIEAGGTGEVPAARVWRPKVEDSERALDWQRDATADILRKVRSADGMPGALADIAGQRLRVFDCHAEAVLAGRPGQVLARREGALCVATADGAVWVGHLKALPGEGAERPFKQAATTLLSAVAASVPESPMPHPADMPAKPTLQEISYRETGAVGRLAFDVYNGGLTVAQARRLVAALDYAAARPTRVLVLDGGAQVWSNGIDLMSVEASGNPAETSWQTINAIDDVALALLTMTGKVTVAALAGNAGAGGVFLALACDEVLARDGVVLNPHYKNMGNLYGSEYWTYVLPRRLGDTGTAAIMAARLPVGVAEARRLRLVDSVGPADREAFASHVAAHAAALAGDGGLAERLADKASRRATDEAKKPLSAYREEELARMRKNFFGFDPSYHVARYNFIAKVPLSRTPHHLGDLLAS